MAGQLTRDDAFSIADPAIASLWIVRMPFGADLKDIVAESITMTKYKTPSVARFNGGSNSYFPGTSDIDGLAITFYETHDYRVTRYFEKWRLSVFNPESGVYGMPKDYKQSIKTELYSNLSTSPVMEYEYKYCWPTDIQAFEMNYTDETARITVQVQLSVDTVK
jgi:hypothetical protein